jgi:broad-specificity NMP kinase
MKGHVARGNLARLQRSQMFIESHVSHTPHDPGWGRIVVLCKEKKVLQKELEKYQPLKQ